MNSQKKKNEQNEQIKKFTVRLPPEIYRTLKLYGVDTDMDLQDIIRDAALCYIKSQIWLPDIPIYAT